MQPHSADRPLVCMNTKMYFDRLTGEAWLRCVAALLEDVDLLGHLDLVLLPDYLCLPVARELFECSPVRYGAQDLCADGPGPFTGEIAGSSLRQMGCSWVLIGHAERRRRHGENDTSVRAKVAAACENGLTPIVCIGEEERSTGLEAARPCVRQMSVALEVVPAGGSVVVAYEPVWAIGQAAPAGAGHVAPVIEQLRAAATGYPCHVEFIYGGSVQAGLWGTFRPFLDGLFVGRAGHDPSALVALLRELAPGGVQFAGTRTAMDS